MKDGSEVIADASAVKKTRKGTWIKKEFSASAMLFWIKGSIAVDYHGVHVTQKNTMLGIFPSGESRQTIPLRSISNADISTDSKFSRYLIGVIIALFGFATLGSSALLGLILVAIGVLTFLNGILTSLVIEKNGTALVLNVPFFNKQDMVTVKDVIDQAVEIEDDKTDRGLYQHRLADDDQDDLD